MFKYVQAVFDSAYLSYVGYKGGRVEGGTWYLLWPIHIKPNVPTEFVGMYVVPLRRLSFCFHYDYG